jgi:nitrogen fixation NifU-like protein
MYSNKIIDHFQNPRNMGEIKNPDVKARVGNKVCGDVMEIYLNIDNNNKITKAKFQTFGCAAAIATSSIITELVIGKSVSEAQKIKPKDIDSSLGGLPNIKKHCADLSIEALNKALDKYQKS